MIHTPDNCRDRALVDVRGAKIPYVLAFNDETFEATILVTGVDGKPIKRGISMQKGLEFVEANVTIHGARLVDIKTFKEKRKQC